MMNRFYGVTVRSFTGSDVYSFSTRGEADRVRRVVRAWRKAGGWPGAGTLAQVVNLASERAGVKTEQIIKECFARQRQGEE